MKTLTLTQFVEREITSNIESGFGFMITDSMEGDVEFTLQNEGAKSQMWETMKKRYRTLQSNGKLSALEINEESKFISYTI